MGTVAVNAFKKEKMKAFTALVTPILRTALIVTEWEFNIKRSIPLTFNRNEAWRGMVSAVEVFEYIILGYMYEGPESLHAVCLWLLLICHR